MAIHRTRCRYDPRHNAARPKEEEEAEEEAEAEEAEGEAMTKAPGTTTAALLAEYAGWFVQLQALTRRKLDPWDWTGQWNKGLTPKEAIANDD